MRRRAILLLLALSACASSETSTNAEEPAEASPQSTSAVESPLVSLSRVESPDGQVKVDVRYQRPDDFAAPRVMEVRLKLSDGLSFESAEAGPALVDAGKQLIARASEDGVLRLIGLSTANTQTVEPGVLATLTLQHAAGSVARIELLEGQPVFAPADANAGLVLGPPLVEAAR